jgi:serine/threonine protein kinase
MSAGSFHESDLAQAISQIKVSNIFGYRNLLAYLSSLGVPVVEPDQYAKLTYVASGSYSTIYSTNDLTTGNTVALKTPRSSLSRADARLEDEAYHRALSSIIQELRILAHQSLAAHPNLPKVIGVCFRQDYHQDEASIAILQEYAFCDLRHYLVSSDSIPMTKKAHLALDVARGICALHSYHLVHGDIHPKNILLFRRDDSLIAAVGDLGTCGVESSPAFIPGTKPFWAPECHPRSQFHNDHVNSSARDVYAFGLLLNSMIASSYADETFPPDQQFDIQHHQKKTLQHLEQKHGTDHRFDKLVDVVLLAVKVEPHARADIATICRELESICGEERYYLAIAIE